MKLREANKNDENGVSEYESIKEIEDITKMTFAFIETFLNNNLVI